MPINLKNKTVDSFSDIQARQAIWDSTFRGKDPKEIASVNSYAEAIFEGRGASQDTIRDLKTMHSQARTVDLPSAVATTMVQNPVELLNLVASCQKRNLTAEAEKVKRVYEQFYAGENLESRGLEIGNVDALANFTGQSRSTIRELTQKRGIDASTTPGGQDWAIQTVTEAIYKQIQNRSEIYSLLSRISNRARITDVRTYVNGATGGFVGVAANLPEITNTVEAGMGKRPLESIKYGLLYTLEAEAFYKLDTLSLEEILNIATQAYDLGIRQKIYTGTGTNEPTGLATNATSINFADAGNIYTAITKMASAIAAANVQNSALEADLFIVTNMSVYFNIINELQAGNLSDLFSRAEDGTVNYAGVDIYKDSAIGTTGTSPNVSGPMYMGVKGHYVLLEQLPMQVAVSTDALFQSGAQQVRLMGSLNGTPAFVNSFAKTTVPALH